MSAKVDQEYVHVVVGIIKNENYEVLLSKRKLDVHLGGLFEFPGGKVEKNESPTEALHRELFEELDINALSFTSLIQVPYQYSNKNILLDAYLINDYSGKIISKEGQEISWLSVDSFCDQNFPAANFGIIRALKLPNTFLVTPSFSDDEYFLDKIESIICSKKVRIIQLRSHEMDDQKYMKLAERCANLCRNNDVKLILNRDERGISGLEIAGIHLTSERLLKAKKRPLGSNYIVGASCHSLNEVQHANQLRVDYVFLGPVLEKQKVLESKVLGWDGFTELTSFCQIPSYAIGGVGPDHLDQSIQSGGQGIASIRAIWER